MFQIYDRSFQHHVTSLGKNTLRVGVYIYISMGRMINKSGKEVYLGIKTTFYCGRNVLVLYSSLDIKVGEALGILCPASIKTNTHIIAM